jgi:23S rRNA pseudouridine1911/1915/1917 synthase
MEKLYGDKRIFVCLKPVGVVSTDQPGGLPELVRRDLGDEKACVRTVHRLDQVVGGVMVLARSRVAAQLLSEQMRQGRFEKKYLAVVQGSVEPGEDTLRDLLRRDKVHRKTFVTDTPGQDVREAVLSYLVLARREGMSLLCIKLGTGRTHQIRCQLAHRGWPLVGDGKYGAQPRDMEGIALWSTALTFDHPQTGERLHFSALPPRGWPWTVFEEELG